MKKMNALDWIAVILVMIGGLNWGLVGFFNYDIIAAIFGDMSTVSRIIYDLVGIAALYKIFMMSQLSDEKKVISSSAE